MKMYSNLDKRNDLKKELDTLNSSLNQLDSHYKYEVPEGFFNEMQEKVIQSKGTDKRGVIKYKMSKWLMASAAILVILLGSIWLMNSYQKSELDNLSHDQIFSYLEQEHLYDNILTIDLLDYLGDDLLTFEENLDFDGAENYLENNFYEFSVEELDSY